VDNVPSRSWLLLVTAGDSGVGLRCVCVCVSILKAFLPMLYFVTALVLMRLTSVRCFELVLVSEGCCIGAGVCLGYTEHATEFEFPKKFSRHWESPGGGGGGGNWMNGNQIHRIKQKRSKI